MSIPDSDSNPQSTPAASDKQPTNSAEKKRWEKPVALPLEPSAAETSQFNPPSDEAEFSAPS